MHNFKFRLDDTNSAIDYYPWRKVPCSFFYTQAEAKEFISTYSSSEVINFSWRNGYKGIPGTPHRGDGGGRYWVVYLDPEPATNEWGEVAP